MDRPSVRIRGTCLPTYLYDAVAENSLFLKENIRHDVLCTHTHTHTYTHTYKERSTQQYREAADPRVNRQ